MRFVALEKAKPGMVLGTDLYDLQGRTVIGHGSELTENYIKRLIEYGFSGVYIEDEYSKDIVIETSISPQLRQEGMRSIRNCDVDKCVEVAKEIVKEARTEAPGKKRGRPKKATVDSLMKIANEVEAIENGKRFD